MHINEAELLCMPNFMSIKTTGDAVEKASKLDFCSDPPWREGAENFTRFRLSVAMKGFGQSRVQLYCTLTKTEPLINAN